MGLSLPSVGFEPHYAGQEGMNLLSTPGCFPWLHWSNNFS